MMFYFKCFLFILFFNFSIEGASVKVSTFDNFQFPSILSSDNESQFDRLDFDSIFKKKFPKFYEKYHDKHNLSSLFSLHKDLIDIESISSNEHNIGNFLVRLFKQHGFQVDIQPVNEWKFNIFAYFNTENDQVKNKKSHKKILLTTHIDTVPPFISYYFNQTEGNIYGRGANDAKSSIAAQFVAAMELVNENKINLSDLAILLVVNEETGGEGMYKAMDYLKDYSFGTAIFGEPTENKLSIGHKGNYMFDVETFGLKSHSGYPQLGVSSNEILIDFLWMLNFNTTFKQNQLLGPTTMNIGKLYGGIASNVLPDYSAANIFFRVADNVKDINTTVHQLIDFINNKYSKIYPDFDKQHFVGMKNLLVKDPQFLDFEVPGFDTIVSAFSTDIPQFSLPVKKRYLYGPGSILSAHSDREFCSIYDLVEAVEGYKSLISYSLYETN